MSDETRRVLELLAQGKVSVDEAHQLLQALKEQSGKTSVVTKVESGGKPRFMRIHVHKPAKEGKEAKDVNVRVPMAILRGGMRLGTMIPGLQDRVSARLREKGLDIDLAKMDPAALESLLTDMGEINIDVNGGESVRITCE